jgi:hypothetical protein
MGRFLFLLFLFFSTFTITVQAGENDIRNLSAIRTGFNNTEADVSWDTSLAPNYFLVNGVSGSTAQGYCNASDYSTTDTFAHFTGLNSNTSYSFTVYAYDKFDNELDIDTYTVGMGPDENAIQNLSAEYTYYTQATVSWSASNSVRGSYFNMTRGSNPQGFCDPSNDFFTLDTQVTFSNLQPGTSYSFTVCGYDDLGEELDVDTFTLGPNTEPPKALK